MRTKITAFIAILVGLLAFKHLVMDSKDKKSTQTPTTTPEKTTPTPQPTIPTPGKPKETHLPPTTGWTFTHRGSGYDWFVPLVVGEPTAWFTMTDLNTTYRVKKTCVVEMLAKTGGSTTTFLVNTSTDTRHIKLPNGDFSPDPWPEAEFQKVAMAAQAIRFKPYNSGSLEVKMGRTE